MKSTKYITLIFLIGSVHQLLAQAIEEPWLKRNWNDMIAHYNIYFNAKQKLENSISTLARKHQDDFNTIIDVFPYGSEADANSIKDPLEIAMKKASKVIQNKPNSKWVDDAYFLIGQTQFFSGDYFSSIETFQFVNKSFKDPRTKILSQLWLMKSYIQQNKYDDAEAIYSLLKEAIIKYPTIKRDLFIAAGDLMVKQNKKNEAIDLLTKGVTKLKDKTLRYRTYFVLGQLYMSLEDYPKASTSFIKVLKLNAPYEYVFQANLGMAKSTANNDRQGIQKTKKYLRRMLDDDKNTDYFDQIYYELAKLEFSTKNNAEGLAYMKESARNSSSNQIQKTKTYLYLADYYFNNRLYPNAQAYYDSTIAEIPDNYPDVQKIKSKHAVLSRLIENIQTIYEQDSLLRLSFLDRAELDQKINTLIRAEREKERIAAEEAALRRDQELMNTNNNSSLSGQNNTGGVWYFYNASAVARGTNEFNRLWGRRPYANFWRYINKTSMTDVLIGDNTDTEEEPGEDSYNSFDDQEQQEVMKDIAEDKKKYYEKIPFSQTAQTIAKRKVETAHLDVAKIYFEDLKENERASYHFSTLIDQYPKTSYKPEALFYLTKIALMSGDSVLAQQLSTQVSEEFPSTIYNSILNTKEIPEDNTQTEVLEAYKSMYTAFVNKNYDSVFAIKSYIDLNHAGNSIQDKIDYIHALTIGKTKGKEAYIKELEGIKEVYQGTAISELASYTLRVLLEPEQEKTTELIFDSNLDDVFYYVITGITANEKDVKIKINDFNNDLFSLVPLRISSIVWGDRTLFYIKQFSNKSTAIRYHKEIENKKQFLLNAGLSSLKYYPITEPNFRLLISNKKEIAYIDQFKTILIQ